MPEITNEQKLVDMCFGIAMAMHDKHHRTMFNKMSQEQLVKWVAKQLSDCGFKTKPCGAKWGVLTK